MSERLRKAYEAKEQKRIGNAVREANAEHLQRMAKAGEAYLKRHNSGRDACERCGKTDCLLFVQTDDLMHYGKMVCSRCGGKFIRWIPYPKTVWEGGLF